MNKPTTRLPEAKRGLFRVVAETLGARPQTQLPVRVTERIARQEDDAEVMVRLFQLAIVILFGSLYFLAPRTDAGTVFAFAPYVIAFYFVVTMIGLVWSLRRRLPDWAVYGSIGFDISLLLLMIWSFHLQYEQPASFYLKAPTLLYVFIFIALRALRYRARFVIATGALAAIGWVGMVLYVVLIDPDDTMITRSYVEYLTDNAVLIGAEVDKIVSILTVTAILAIVLRRARRVLVQAVTEETAARDLSRFFDPSVAARIRGSEEEAAAGHGAFCDAAILYVDIRGFSTLAAQIDPDTAMALLAEYQRRLVPIVQSHGGTIDKFLGDGIMATFGTTDRPDSYAADALAAMDAIIDEAEAWRQQQQAAGGHTLAINAAVASGRVMVGAVGEDSRLEYTVIGSAVNLAAKLEKHNKALGSKALADAETFRLAMSQRFAPTEEPRQFRQTIEGLAAPQDIIILRA